MSFEEDIKRIEEIAQKLSTSTTPLEEAISLYEEGMTLTKKLEKTLGEAKRKVEMVQGQEIEQAEITPLE
ncbi:MAG: exodeoxyribonuclease VII small subunit [Sphaerochaeta sp.]|jgi:exodeoxyribonuclease VII small subunit|nr:exodeoxyribonuclease VII small subunit [Spirochaetales bacterium]